GAGLSGLTVALTLLQNGIPVRIIERNVEHRQGQRGAGIAPRGMEVYHFLGVNEIGRDKQPILPLRTYHVGGKEPLQTLPMFPSYEATPSRPYINYAFLGQDIMEGHLREHLAKYSCFVELGTELRSFQQYSTHVEARIGKVSDPGHPEEVINVEWLIGADGARGVVRKNLGVTFLGETRDESAMLVGDVKVGGLDEDHWHIWGTMGSDLVALRATKDLGEGGFVLFASGRGINAKVLATDNDALFEWMQTVTERDDLTFERVHWVSEFRPNIRMANKFGDGRVFIVGGAYGVHSPTGGQGANSSVQDSLNLGWKLALVVKGFSPPSLLETYTEERLPVIAEMLKLTTFLLDKNIETDRECQGTSWQRGHEYFQLGVNYRGSRITLDEDQSGQVEANPYGDFKAETLRSGDRAPDAPGLRPLGSLHDPKLRLFDVFKSHCHTALVFANDSMQAGPIRTELERLPRGILHSLLLLPEGSSDSNRYGVDGVVIDTRGHAYDAYKAKKGQLKVVIVRPDGTIGAIVRDIGGIRRYFRMILWNIE
ncbi:FAD binding domain-containing protein, partial [Suillus clintonianus]|uniref:FAD binding domain-containing protein n=1 Tax=Suillus clintonianus TaxID=1904413 RepID=UPI001B8621ED